nr:hypothetical protein [Gluconacetobacter azotocaptans]
MARRLNVAPERIEAVRQRLMRFNPVGVAAMSLAECLAVQLQARNRFDPAMAALLANLDLLARGERNRLRAACGVDADDLAEMIAELRALNPRPWAEDAADPVQTRIPDLIVQEGPNGTWRVAAAQDLSRDGRAERRPGRPAGNPAPRGRTQTCRRLAVGRALAGTCAGATSAQPDGGGRTYPVPTGRFHDARAGGAAPADDAAHRRRPWPPAPTSAA